MSIEKTRGETIRHEFEPKEVEEARQVILKALTDSKIKPLSGLTAMIVICKQLQERLGIKVQEVGLVDEPEGAIKC